MPSSHHPHSSTASPTPTASSSSDTPPTNNNTTIIIAVVAGCVGGIILIFVIIRLIRHRLNRNRSNPLPPVQPIAHHREQQLAQFEEQKFFAPASGSGGNSNGYGSRSSTWYANQHLMAPQFSPSNGSISDASLLPHNNKEFDTYAPATDMSVDHGISMTDERSLSPPPPFQGMAAMTTIPPGDTGLPGEDPNLIMPSRSRVSSRSSPRPPASLSSHNFNPSLPPPNIPNPNPYPTLRQPRTRPSSLHSTASRRSTATAVSANIIRGVPHGPHSSVQIVLPAPLAHGLGSQYGYGRRSDEFGVIVGDSREGSVRSRSRVDSHSRLSIVDKWAGVPGGNSEGGRERGGESRRGRERERRTLKKVERKASSASADINVDRRNSTSTSHSYTSHQSHSHSVSHYPYPHPPSKSPLFRSHSPNTSTSSPPLSLTNNANSVSHLHPSSPSPPPMLARTSSSAPPFAFRNHSLTPPPVPRIPSMYNSFNNHFDSVPEVEVERGRRSTPPAGFGIESPSPSFSQVQRESPGAREYDVRTATSTPSL